MGDSPLFEPEENFFFKSLDLVSVLHSLMHILSI